MNGWIGVDLDGTLAHYDGWVSETHIGRPIHDMVKRVRNFLEEGYEVRIFTARVYAGNGRDVAAVREAIEEWCLEHIGQVLAVTNEKDYGMIQLWDDRCVQVVPNTGRPILSEV